MGSHGFPWVPLGSHGSSARNCWVTDEPNWKVWRFHRAPLPYTYTVGTWFRNEGHRHNQPSLCRCESQSFNIFHHHTGLDTPCVFIHAGGVLKWGYPKSPWISILKWILKRTNGLLWNNWGTYFRKAPYVRATHCPSSDKIFGTHSLFGVHPVTFRCTPSVAVISFHFCTSICTFSVFPGPDRSKLTNFAANTALLVLIILYHSSHYIQFVVLVSSCFLIIDVWTDRVVKVRFKKTAPAPAHECTYYWAPKTKIMATRLSPTAVAENRNANPWFIWFIWYIYIYVLIYICDIDIYI